VELLEQVGSNQKIVFHEVKENKYRNLKTAERYSIETWYRFMASDIFDESIDRVLWLDSDIISNMWNMFPIVKTKEMDEEIKNEFEQIKIIHFVSKKKPWQEECSNYWEAVSAEREYSHMCYDLYLRYLGEMTAYLEENTMVEQKKITDEVEVLISESKGKEKEVIHKIYDIIDSIDDDLLGIYLYSRILKSSLVRFTDNLIANIRDVYELVMSVYEMKPECIIDIGGMSMVANICSS
jgi:lipopolysaccharide biosynthesis glycosyltransferase